MRLIDLSDGRPALWKSDIYGDVAVHIVSSYQGVIKVTVDGGESARQVIDHPELADGWFVIPERLHKRVSKPRKTGVSRAEARIVPAEVLKAHVAGAAELKNTIREVPGVGKVAVITNDPPKTTAQRNKRRLSLNSALKEARAMADIDANIWWPFTVKNMMEEF